MKKATAILATLLGVSISGFAQFQYQPTGYGWGNSNLFNTGEVYDEPTNVRYHSYYNSWNSMNRSSYAQPNTGGLFYRGANPIGFYSNFSGLVLPPDHGLLDDQDAAPLGSGIAVLVGLGAAYTLAKRRKE